MLKDASFLIHALSLGWPLIVERVGCFVHSAVMAM